MASGERQRPLDLIGDEDAVELSFPTVFAGNKRKCSVSYLTIVRSELRNFDWRGCRTDQIFYSYKKLEMMYMRKHTAPRCITADNALSDDHMTNLILHDEGYRVLKGIRSSPAHWEGEK